MIDIAEALSLHSLQAAFQVAEMPLDDTAAVRRKITPETAAILIEPIQGEGGVRTPAVHFLKSLRQMCDAVNIWKSGSKVQLAAGLLNWRNRCRLEGQAFLTQLRAESQSRPVQLQLTLFISQGSSTNPSNGRIRLNSDKYHYA